MYGNYSMGGASKIVHFVDFPVENLNLSNYILDKVKNFLNLGL